MGKMIIFAGTTEGRTLARKAAEEGQEILVCVTSAYARSLLGEEIPCHVGALDEDGMMQLLGDYMPERIVDATHPFAQAVSDNIRRCAQRLGIELTEAGRAAEHGRAWENAVHWVKDAEEAAKAASGIGGRVLLTTGCNTLSLYAAEIEKERLYARVLPTIRSLRCCDEAGVLPSHVIAMQGPFSQELNAAIYDRFAIDVMISKDSGEVGGVSDKVMPALRKGIEVIMIRRPD